MSETESRKRVADESAEETANGAKVSKTDEITITVRTLDGKRHEIKTLRSAPMKVEEELYRPYIPQIESENFNVIHRNIMKTLGWERDFAAAAVREYFQFLELKMIVEDWNAEILSPSPLLDQIWHLHILDTRSYETDCRDIFDVNVRFDAPGRVFQFIHHAPDGAHDGHSAQRLKNTHLAYKVRHFRDASALFWSAEAVPKFSLGSGTINTVPLIDAIAHKTGYPPCQIKLIHAGREMDLTRSLEHYNISDGNEIFLILRLSGC